MTFRALVLIFTAIAIACSAGRDGANHPTGSSESSLSSSMSASSVADALRASGSSVTSAGTVQQPFFDVPAQVFVVDGDDLQIYEFASATDAGKAAAEVAPNGGSIGTAMMSWMAPPHFFRNERLLINYLGSSQKTLSALQRLLGPQFAGR